MTKRVPRSVTWNVGDRPVEGRLVTHVRVPMSRVRWRLPEAMPATWVAKLTLIAFVLAAVAAVLVLLTVRPLLIGVALSFGAVLLTVAIVGAAALFIARWRLRKEAYAVLDALDEPMREYFDESDHQMLSSLLVSDDFRVIDQKSGILKK